MFEGEPVPEGLEVAVLVGDEETRGLGDKETVCEGESEIEKVGVPEGVGVNVPVEDKVGETVEE